MNLQSWMPSGGLRQELAHLRTALIAAGITFLAMYMYYHREVIPSAKLADMGMPAGKVYQKDYQFTKDWFLGNVPVWEKATAAYKGKSGIKYLEVGVFEGRSSLWMLDNVLTGEGCHATGIDIFSGPLKERFLSNLELSGHGDKYTLIVGPSQEELRKLPLASYDIIYIDGSHTKPDVLEDAILSMRLLKPGGLFIFDDYRWPREDNGPKLALDIFFQVYGDQFEVLHNDYQLFLRKKPAPAS